MMDARAWRGCKKWGFVVYQVQSTVFYTVDNEKRREEGGGERWTPM